MCGIAGIWNLPTLPAPECAVAQMLTAMHHRGPDGQGLLSYQGGAAGMVRLALVDLSPRGQQPLWSPDRRVAILFNGEIYNFRELREPLEREGYPFISQTDTEVILALYCKYGLDFPAKLRGMYAIAIFDWRQTTPEGAPELLLVRGPYGIKPLYVAAPPDAPRSVIFASELRVMLASGVIPRQFDREGVADFLSCGFVLQPRTMIHGVRMLEPGTWELYSPNKPVRSHKFYRLPECKPRQESLEEASERLRAVLEESVRLHALADAPVGAFLSGGVDSTGIVGLMRQHVSKLRTYTLRFPEFKDQDESVYAEEAARDYGCENTIVDVVGKDVAELLPRFASDLDQPSTDGLNSWLISRAAARDVKGVLSGIGGDEWFAGYPVTRRMAWYSKSWVGFLERTLGYTAHLLRPLAPTAWGRWKLNNIASRRSGLATWMHTRTIFRHDEVIDLLGLPQRVPLEHQLRGMLDGIATDWSAESPVGLSCLLDSWIYMRCQLLRDSDATSMAHSLELRVPFVDSEIVNFSRSCRDEYKLSSDGGAYGTYAASGSKRVLIHALRDVLPSSLMNRVKRGFALPIQSWMRREFLSLFEETCNPDAVAARGLLDPDAVQPCFEQRNSNWGGMSFTIPWSMMMLELWCRAVIDAPLPGTATANAMPTIFSKPGVHEA